MQAILEEELILTDEPVLADIPTPREGVHRSAMMRALRVFLALIPLLTVHLSLIAMFYVEITWASVIMFIVTTRFAGLGITVGFHRYFSHRSFKTSRWFQFMMGAAGCTAMQKGPLWWVIHHRLHHKHSDTEHDPHSPVVDSFIYGHMGWLFMNDLMKPDMSIVKDLTKYREIVLLEKFWMIPGFLLAGLCFLVDYLAGNSGWAGLVYGYCLATAVIFQVTFAVNSFGHRVGPQRFNTGDGSRNNWVLGIIALGDGWHNNHHRAPTSARHGMAWYEFDMAYSMIKILKRMGIVWGIRLPPEAAMAIARGEVVAAPATPVAG